MNDSEFDPFALRDQPVVRLTVQLPADTALAVYHYCIRSGADESKMPVALVRIAAAFLERDAGFRRWRASQAEALPQAVPVRRARRARAGGRRA